MEIELGEIIVDEELEIGDVELDIIKIYSDAGKIEIIPTKEEQIKEGLFNKVTVKGDEELISENIKEGIEIFGVGGTFKGRTEEDIELEASFISSIDNSLGANVTKLPEGLTSLCKSAFTGRTDLALTELPKGVTSISSYIFGGCINLTEMTCNGVVTLVSSYVFNNCSNLTKLAFPNIKKVPPLTHINAFTNTPIANGTGYIYVPDDLVDSFKTATNWSTYANQIKAISEMEG